MNKADAEFEFFGWYTPTDDIGENKYEWQCHVDNLNKSGEITDKQAHNWGYPNKQKNKFLYKSER
jgi:hypothetical protein